MHSTCTFLHAAACIFAPKASKHPIRCADVSPLGGVDIKRTLQGLKNKWPAAFWNLFSVHQKDKTSFYLSHPNTFPWVAMKWELMNCALRSGAIPVRVRRSSSMLMLALTSSQLQRRLVVSAACRRPCQAHTWCHTAANAAAKWPHRWSQLSTSKRIGEVGILASELKALKGK